MFIFFFLSFFLHSLQNLPTPLSPFCMISRTHTFHLVVPFFSMYFFILSLPPFTFAMPVMFPQKPLNFFSHHCMCLSDVTSDWS